MDKNDRIDKEKKQSYNNIIYEITKILDNINLSTGVLTSPEELEHGLALELKLIFLHSLRASFTCLHPLGS